MSRMCEEELQLMADKCHSLQAQCQMLKEDVAWYKDQLAELQRIKLDNHTVECGRCHALCETFPQIVVRPRCIFKRCFRIQ